MDGVVMDSSLESYYHKGFYQADEDRLYDIENPAWDYSDDQDNVPGFAYDNAHVFLMGSCEIFAHALQQQIGYTAYEIRGKNDRLIHAFCISIYQGKKAFVDVRGVTTDWDEFLSGFLVYPGEKPIIKRQQMDHLELTMDEIFGYQFACWIIEQYRPIYII